MRAAREEIQKIFSVAEGLQADENESVTLSREQLDNMPVLGEHTAYSPQGVQLLASASKESTMTQYSFA